MIRRCVGARSFCALLGVLLCLLMGTSATASDFTFVRGDTTGNGVLELGDVVGLLTYMFLDPDEPPLCFDAYDVTDSGAIELGDPIYSLNYQFIPGSPLPPAPFPGCGVDPTDDALDCSGPLQGCFAKELALPRIETPDAVAGSLEGVGLFVPVMDDSSLPFEAARIMMARLEVMAPESAPDSSVIVEWDAQLQVFDDLGNALTSPETLLDSEFPKTLFVSGDEVGRHSLQARSVVTGAVVDALFRVGRFPGLAAKGLLQYPHFQFVRTFNAGDAIEIAVDPFRHADRIDREYRAYVVAHKTPSEWISDPTLSDVTGGFEIGIVTGPSIVDNSLLVASSLPAGDHFGAPYDIVLDFDQNGVLSTGDLIDSFVAPDAGCYSVKDITLPGPYAVGSFDHSAAFFLTQRIYYPTNLDQLGEVPLVVISHGNGHEYFWYEYLQSHLASYGYIVMSHRNNTNPGIGAASTTTLTNTDEILASASSMGGGVLAGHIDGERIIWIGHSRGGEGVVRAYERLVSGSYVAAEFDAEDVIVISSIAPTVFNSVTVSDPNAVNYHVIMGAADGDVTGGVDCVPCQSLRLAQAATGNTQVTYIHGADHNDFNCCGFDDGIGPDQIGRDATQAVARGYLVALLEYYANDNWAAKEFFTRMFDDLRPSGVDPVVVCANQYRQGLVEAVRVVDDFQSDADVDFTSLGGLVSFDVSNVFEARLDDLNLSLEWIATGSSAAMNGMTQASGSSDSDFGVVFDWPGGSDRFYELGVVSEVVDFSSFDFLSFRVCQGTRHPNTVQLDGPLYFAVSLVDEDGVVSTIRTDNYGGVSSPYPREGLGLGSGWSNEFNTVRLRVTDFECDGSGIDLTAIESVRFHFGDSHGSDVGRIGLDTVVLEKE